MENNNLTVDNNQSIVNDLFRDIYSSFSNKVFNFAYKIVGNKTIAEDITQETFIQVYLTINYNFKEI